jgi:Flp pilus assembly protein TadG
MIHGLCQRAFKAARTFLRDQSGSIIIYTGAFLAIGVGGAALSIDIGRIVLLTTQLQNRADAGALAGAAQLDAQPGAIDRARSIMSNAMVAYTNAAADQGELSTWYTKFYAPTEDYITRGAETTDDVAARFAEVVMDRRTLSFFYAPAMNIMTGGNPDSYSMLDARAVAMSDPFICKAQPLMICNPLEDDDPLTDDPLPDDSYAGRSITLKQGTHGGGTWTAGNFGMLNLPNDAGYTESGAGAVAAALSAEEPSGCYGYSIVTAPGSMTMKVSDAINTRFGMDVLDSTVIPAPNVMNYPKDNVMLPGDPTYDSTLIMGDGNWDLATYWADKHPGVPIPSPELDGVGRFHIYLFEQGVTFWRKKGGKTVRVVLDAAEISTGNWTEIIPANFPDAAVLPSNDDFPDDNWLDGRPPPGQTVSPADPDVHVEGWERRVLRVNIMNCKTLDVAGKGDYESQGNYIEIFLTQEADGPAGGAGIYGEYVRKMDPRISLEFHGNVRLTE